MNKQWKLLIGTLLSLLMYSCSVVEEEQNVVVNIKDASELYGTWEYESSSIITGYLGDNTTPYYYVLSKDTAIFIQKLSSSDKKALLKINKIQWSLNDSITIALKPDLRELQGYEYSWDYKTIKPSVSVKGFDTVWAYAYSDLDSVIHHNNINNTTKLTDQSFVIINLTKSRMTMVPDSCYNSNMGASSISDQCEVITYSRDSELDVDALLLSIDTVSTTEVFEKYYK